MLVNELNHGREDGIVAHTSRVEVAIQDNIDGTAAPGHHIMPFLSAWFLLPLAILINPLSLQHDRSTQLISFGDASGGAVKRSNLTSFLFGSWPSA